MLYSPIMELGYSRSSSIAEKECNKSCITAWTLAYRWTHLEVIHRDQQMCASKQIEDTNILSTLPWHDQTMVFNHIYWDERGFNTHVWMR
jgi:hypothetical protein